jgi:uncharacterized protein YebE (UPF0316 family)
MDFLDKPVFDYLLIPLLIFFLRICDVTLDTLRIIFISRGFKAVAPFVGFFEVLIWIIAISRIFENLNNWLCYIGYAAGFATGNFVGMLIDEKLAIGHEIIRVITKIEAVDLISALREKGYGVTSLKATGMHGDVGVIFMIINRKNLKEVTEIIKKYNPNAFYTIEDVNYVNRAADPYVIPRSRKKNFFSLIKR